MRKEWGGHEPLTITAPFYLTFVSSTLFRVTEGKCYFNIVKVRAVKCHLVNWGPWGQIQVLSLSLSGPLYSADLLILGCVSWRPGGKGRRQLFSWLLKSFLIYAEGDHPQKVEGPAWGEKQVEITCPCHHHSTLNTHSEQCSQA